ncbi:hypothetical protein F2Q70_00044990, partial [Brassica cretica]
KEFFQEAGEVVDVKFGMGRDDGSFRGFGHILFASPVEAQMALGFQGRTLLGRQIRLDMALESASVLIFFLKHLDSAIGVKVSAWSSIPSKKRLVCLKSIVYYLLGTVNIHPSLLPLYRGAAPVQRALQDGVEETGVSLAFTVRKLDAGAVIASKSFQVDDQIKILCGKNYAGSKLLIRELPSIFDGSAKSEAVPQDDSKATLAPKIAPDEAWLSFDQEAFILHNKVRAFAGWPGTRAKVLVLDDKSGQQNELELKIITTRICQSTEVLNGEQDYVTFKKGSLAFPCGGGTALEVLEVQLPGKKAIDATAFWNGLRGQKLKKL